MISRETLLSRIDKQRNGCWIWTGAKWGHGYGQISEQCDGKRVLRVAHRVAYEILIGAVPAGLVLDHLCRVRSCVNPAHLQPVTPAENTRRGAGASTINAKKTHCPQGHPYSAENTLYYAPKGAPRRYCRTCKRAARVAWYWRSKRVGGIHAQ